jgi:hypothetical protein
VCGGRDGKGEGDSGVQQGLHGDSFVVRVRTGTKQRAGRG